MRKARFSGSLVSMGVGIALDGFQKTGRTDPETLVLPADEHGRQQVPADEQHEEQIMQRRVVHGVVHAQADEPDGADGREEDAQGDEHLLGERLVRHEAAPMPQPALGEEGGVEGEGGEDTARDEERLHLVGADVADVGEGLAVGDGRVASAVRADDPVEEEAEEHAEPDEAREDGEPLGEGGVSGGGVGLEVIGDWRQDVPSMRRGLWLPLWAIEE